MTDTKRIKYNTLDQHKMIQYLTHRNTLLREKIDRYTEWYSKDRFERFMNIPHVNKGEWYKYT